MHVMVPVRYVVGPPTNGATPAAMAVCIFYRKMQCSDGEVVKRWWRANAWNAAVSNYF